MLRLVHVEELEGLVLRLPALVGEHERRDPGFAAHAGDWLAALEQALAANRLYHAGLVAALRSDLGAAQQGQVPEGITFRGRATRSRVLGAAAMQAVRRAATIVSGVIEEQRPRLAEAERIAGQIVAVAWARGLIPVRGPADDNTQYLGAVRRAVGAAGDLEPVVVHLEGLVGPHDALAFLDRALAQYHDRA